MIPFLNFIFINSWYNLNYQIIKTQDLYYITVRIIFLKVLSNLLAIIKDQAL